MDLITLGEYALKPALNVGLRLKKLYTSEVDDGIIAAFEFALNDWSKHAPTTSDKVRLSKALEGYVQNATSYEALDPDTRAFIDCFKKRLSEQPAAHNYLMTLRADEQIDSHRQLITNQRITQSQLQELMSKVESLGVTPKYILAILKDLPVREGREATIIAIKQMFEAGRIHSEATKDLIIEIADYHFSHTDHLREEIERLRQTDNSSLAEILEEINRVLTGESEQSLTAVYQKYQDQERQNGIRVLKELIEAAQIQFSFGEARKFYERLIELAPTIEHRFNYAYLLQGLNDFDKARSHYEGVLQVLRVLAKDNPEICKPYVAATLNNLGILLKDTNELQQAQNCYEEELRIYRELSKQNPEVYKPYVAVTLNNSGTLLSITNEHQLARAYYEEALQIYRELSKQNPEVYKPYVAVTLNNLGNLLGITNEHQQARAYYEEVLRIYRELSRQNPDAYKPALAMTLNNLANSLSSSNECQQARAYYEEVLQIYRELSKQNPETYKPHVAVALSNIGILLKDANEPLQAQSYHEEALQIRRELAEQNPEAYKPVAAITLSNLVILYLQQGKKEKAEKAYQEAYDIYQDLASHHPRAYGIDYAQLLVIGFDLLGKPKEYLEEAKEILGKYPEHPKTQELLSTIEELVKR
jgi:tetratricopeptide repeat protein